MPGKRSAVIAPGLGAALVDTSAAGSDPALLAEAFSRLESGTLTPEWIAASEARSPAVFEATLGGLLDDLARHDIAWYSTRCFRFEDQPLRVRPFDRILQAHIDDCKRDGKWAGILAPPESGKTTIVSMIRASWLVCNNPNIEIKIVSGADDTAVKRVKALGRLFMFDRDFKRVWGHAVQPSQARVRGADPYNDHKITVVRTTQSPEPTVEAYGVLSTAAGARCHVLIFDDAIDEKSTLWSGAAKRHVNEAIQNTWLNRLRKGHRDSHVIWICTKWTDDDQSAIFMASAKWRFLVVSVADDFSHLVCRYMEKGEEVAVKKCPLPEPWTAEILKDTAASMTEAAYARMYKAIATSEVDRVLRHVEDCFDKRMDMQIVGKRAEEENWPCYVGVDVSAKRRRGTTIVVLGVEPKTHHRIPVDARIGAWSSPQICEQLDDVFRRYRPVVIRVENNSVQELFLDMASHVAQGDPNRYQWARKLEPHLTTGRLKHDEEAGVAAMDIEFRNKQWVIPARHMLEHDYNSYEHFSRCGACSLTRQLWDYPNHPTNDMVMGTWIARNAADAYDPRQGEAIRRAVQDVPEDPMLSGGNEWL